MTNAEREYYIKHFCDLVLLNSNEFGSSQTNSIKNKMNLSESEKKVYKEIAYDVYRLLSQNQFIIEHNKLGFEFSITQLGRQERHRLMTIDKIRPTHTQTIISTISKSFKNILSDISFKSGLLLLILGTIIVIILGYLNIKH